MPYIIVRETDTGTLVEGNTKNTRITTKSRFVQDYFVESWNSPQEFEFFLDVLLNQAIF